ncbi:hypothetical protein REH76_16710 [Photobacterium damselae]
MDSAQQWNSQMTPKDKQLHKKLDQRIALAHYEVGWLKEVIDMG